MHDFWDRIDKMGNSFFLKLENLSRNEVLAIMGGFTLLYSYGKMKSGKAKSNPQNFTA